MYWTIINFLRALGNYPIEQILWVPFNFGQTVWYKSEVLLGTSWVTPWKNIGNKAKAKKIPSCAYPPPKVGVS
jgi:hypothetical protein